MKIAFLGLGIMGSRMAKNLLKNKVDVSVYNRSPEPLKELAEAGAKIVNTPKQVVKDADMVFSMLSTPEAVQSVFLQEGKALASMKKGAIWVDCSTVNPSFTKAMEAEAIARGIHCIDAPVAGTKPHAENAELVFFVGGDKKEVEVVRPYLDMMGKKVMHLGVVGQGANFKMLVNMMLAQSMIMFSETILLGEKMGLDKQFLLDTIPNLVVAAPFTKFKAEMIRQDDYEVQFPLEWMYKDLHLATLTAYEHQQPLYLANMAKELFAKATNEGLGRLDFAAVHKVLEKA